MSLLAFYIVSWRHFCLPFMTGRELGSGIQTTATPKIAAGIAWSLTLSYCWSPHGCFCLPQGSRRPARLGSRSDYLSRFSAVCLIFTLAVWLGDCMD